MSKACGKISVIAAIVLTLFVVFSAYFYVDGIAFAKLPDGYVSDVVDNGLDWWTGDDYLGLDDLKRTVKLWKADSSFDFEYLKKNPVIIAVIDSGIDFMHEAFTGKSDATDGKVGEYDVLLRDSNGKPVCRNTVGSPYSPTDLTDDEGRRHGTHVCGIVATLIHSLDLEQYIKIMPIKASVGKDFSYDAVNDALKFAISHGADVVNMSLSSNVENFAGIKYGSFHKDAVLVAAAGNNGLFTKRYPAALSNVVGVMNYREKEKYENELHLSDSSNYGVWKEGAYDIGYDLCAPGNDIFSARGENNPPTGTGNDTSELYKSLSGTSMASPIVAFGAGLAVLKHKALFGDEPVDYIETANLVRNASTSTIKRGTKEYKVFNINALLGNVWHGAKLSFDESLAKQQLGSIKEIEIKFEAIPRDEQGNGSVEWFANDDKIGEGFSIKYTPPATVGDVEIKAIWKHKDLPSEDDIVVEKTVKICVEYVSVTEEFAYNLKINALYDGALQETTQVAIGSVYKLTVANALNLSPDDKNGVIWYVNDEVRHIGEEFDFSPEAEGSYAVKVKIGGYVSRETTFIVPSQTVDKEYKYELKIYTIVVASIIGSIVIVVAVILIIKYAGKKNNSNKV